MGVMLLYIKIFNSIVIANVFYDFTNEFFVVRHFAVFHHCAEVVTQNSSKIVMTGIGQKRTAIRKHTHKRADMARCR